MENQLDTAQLARNILNSPYNQETSSLRILAEEVLRLGALVDDLNIELDSLYDDYDEDDYDEDDLEDLYDYDDEDYE